MRRDKHIRPIPVLFLLLGVAAFSGCTPTGRNPDINAAISNYYSGHYDLARQQLQPYAAKTDENYVLNNVRLGSVELADYNLAGAESAFYKAYEVINSVGVNNAGRSTAAVVVAEQFKVWKGEPFERALTNFYLGLVYYIQQDYNNARAAFENALFKLRDYGAGEAKQDQYRDVETDFTLGYMMLGRCWLRLGREDKAAECFGRAAQLRPDLAGLVDPQRQQTSNVLMVIEFGNGPRKINQGDASIAVFRPRPEQVGPIPLPALAVDNQYIDLRGLNAPPVDTLAIAQDRKWQTFDTIRLAKAAAGYGLMAAGAYEGTKRHPNEGAAIGLIAAGALLKASSQADLRHWEMLPRTIYLLPLRLTPGRHNITVNFGGQFFQTWQGIISPEQGEATYYVRVTGWNQGPYQWPPAKLAAQAK